MCRARVPKLRLSRQCPGVEMKNRFALSDTPFDIAPLRARLMRAEAGAYASFEGWVRNHNDGRAALGLRYEAYVALAAAEGAKIVEEALATFEIADAYKKND